MSSFLRLVKFSIQDFYRNFWLSFVTIVIIILSLLSVSFLVILNVSAGAAIGSVKDKVDISVYFKPEASADEVQSARTEIMNLAQVQDVGYISREEALEQFKQKRQNDPAIMDSLGELDENPLGDTLVIRAKSTDDYPSILSDLDSFDFINLVEKKNFNDYRDIIERLNDITGKVSQLGLVAILIFILIAALVVFNAIQVNIYTHREEIGMMRLMGATDNFVRTPFLLESFFYGLAAWLISIIVIFPALGAIQPYLSIFFGNEQFNVIAYFAQNFMKIFGLQLLMITILGMLSSTIAVRKYLKV